MSWGRGKWLRYNEDEGVFELLCTQCAHWQALDTSMWKPNAGLQRCRVCIRTKRQAEAPLCKSGRHRRIPENLNSRGSCLLCQRENKRLYAERERIRKGRKWTWSRTSKQGVSEKALFRMVGNRAKSGTGVVAGGGIEPPT